MWIVIPKRWFSWDFDVCDSDSNTVAEIQLSNWRERGTLHVQGVEYRVFRESPLGLFLLERDDSIVASAKKPSALFRFFSLACNDIEYGLRARSPVGREFLLCDGSGSVGRITPQGLFNRRAEVDLPEHLPLPFRAFVVWLALLLWKRDSDSPSANPAPLTV